MKALLRTVVVVFLSFALTPGLSAEEIGTPRLGVNADVGPGQAFLYWYPGTDNQDSGVHRLYCFHVDSSGDTIWIERGTQQGETRALIGGLQPGVEYRAFVSALSLSGEEGPASAPVAFLSSPSTAQAAFGVSIRSINTGAFPIITTHVTVSDALGAPVADLAAEHFAAYENGTPQTALFKVIPPSTGEGVRLADIIFLIDDTGSMSGEIAGVRANVTDFANRLAASGVDYRLGLVTFKDNVTPFNGRATTADVNLFKSWVAGLYADGGDDTPENDFDALAEANAWSVRPGAQKILILITDAPAHELGDGTYFAHYTLAQINQILKASSAQVHVVSFNYPQYTGPGSVTAETGGTFYTLGSDFSGIITSIGASISNQYIVQYQSSNPAFDGTDREVRIGVARDSDSGHDIAHYTPGAAPLITLTAATEAALDIAQVAGAAIPIAAQVVDDVPPLVNSVTLHYRLASSSGAYGVLPMSPGAGGTYQASLPSSAVAPPGVSFYIEATDGVAGATLPRIDPSTRPFQFGVLPNKSPFITHTPITTAMNGQRIDVDAVVIDHTHSLSTVRLEYKSGGQFVYTAVDMVPGAADHFTGTIPGSVVTADGVNYVIRASDDLGITSHKGPYTVAVSVSDDYDIALEGFIPSEDGFSYKNGHTEDRTSWSMFEQYFGAEHVSSCIGGPPYKAAKDFFDKTYSVIGTAKKDKITGDPLGNNGWCVGFSSAVAVNYFAIPQPNAGGFSVPCADPLYEASKSAPWAGAEGTYSAPIMFLAATMTSENVASAWRRGFNIHTRPRDVVDSLRCAIETRTPVFVEMLPARNIGGHAVFPYRLRRTGNEAKIWVYDSNAPRDEADDKFITVNLDTDVWTYDRGGSIWSGHGYEPESDWVHAFTFNIVRVNELTKPPVRGSFEYPPVSTACFAPGGRPGEGESASSVSNLLALCGRGALTLCNDDGECTGTEVSDAPEIMGAVPVLPLQWWEGVPEGYGVRVPGGEHYHLSFRGASPDSEGVTVMGNGTFARAIAVGTGAIEMDAWNEGQQVTVSTPQASPMSIDWARYVGSEELSLQWTFASEAGAAWHVAGSPAADDIVFKSLGSGTEYDLTLGTNGSRFAQRRFQGLHLRLGESHVLRGAPWSAIDTAEVVIGVDTDGDGVPDRSLISTAANLNIEPNSLNARSQGTFVKAVIQLRAPWTGATFVPESFRLGTLPAVGPVTVGDDNGDGFADVAVKFDRQAVLAMIGSSALWEAEVHGEAASGVDTIYFSAHDIVPVIRPQVVHPVAGEVLACGADYVVEWTLPSELSADAVSLVYSTDLGLSWMTIVTGLANQTAFTWRTPVVPGTAVLVGVEAFRDGEMLIRGESGSFEITAGTVDVGGLGGTAELRLLAPRPSPAVGRVSIEYELPSPTRVRVSVLDVNGRLVRMLVDQEELSGTQSVTWDGVDRSGSRVGSGIYLLRLEAGGVVRSRRVVFIR